ncbi:TrmH family RNA methyltransferase [Robertmurraya korlensis]|uniref:TrmH family RNA methyltransferase n=1 Tax=Robertmurraya korlensis TaxID=519977 RepID=UPI0008243A2D|nr:RNA methyltransferase [Robertmurraya korlensis]
MKYIQSSSNPKVKQWKKLLTKKERDKTGLFIVEGFHLVEEALKAGRIEEIIVQENIDLPSSFDYGSTPVSSVPVDIIKLLAETDTPQGIFAICHQEQQPSNTEGVSYLLIDAVQDPGNLGTMIRTADAAGVDVVVVGNGSVDMYNSKVLRSAQGSHFHLPVIKGDISAWTNNLLDQGIPVYGTALENAEPFHQIQSTGSYALIVGNEGNGVSKELLSKTTANLYIPIHGKSESLNVAVATGILLYYLRA